MGTGLSALTSAGAAIWVAEPARGLLDAQSLPTMIDGAQISGIVPAFADQATSLTSSQITSLCALMDPLVQTSGGRDGWVSIALDPALADDATATVTAAQDLAAAVQRSNLMVGIPATLAGVSAVSTALAAGISVNVTEIYSIDRYRGVMNACLTGMEQAREAGRDLSRIHSVASFGIHPVDVEVDRRLADLADEQATALVGRAAVANACQAYHAFTEVYCTPRWATLADDGASPQRLMWSQADPTPGQPEYPTRLVADQTVLAMSRASIQALADRQVAIGPALTEGFSESVQVLDTMERLGISYQEVVEALQRQGLAQAGAGWTGSETS